MAVKVAVRQCRGLADVMEERGQPNESSVGRRVDRAEGVVPQVLIRDLVLGHAPLAGEVRRHDGQQAGLLHQAQPDGRPRGREQLDQLGEDTLPRQVGGQPGVATDRLHGRGIDLEVERGRQADGPDHPQCVFLEAPVGIAHRPEETEGKISATAVGIDEDRLHARPGAPGDRVHGEIAAREVLLDRLAELDRVRMAVVGVRDVAPEGGDLVLRPAVAHNHRSEAILVDGPREEGHDPLGRGVGGQVPIGRLTAQQGVAETPAYDVCRVAAAPECCEQMADGCRDLGGTRRRGRALTPVNGQGTGTSARSRSGHREDTA